MVGGGAGKGRERVECRLWYSLGECVGGSVEGLVGIVGCRAGWFLILGWKAGCGGVA